MLKPKIYSDYRKNVGICLFNNKAQVWIGTRMGDFSGVREEPLAYREQFPQGGIDKGEDPIHAAKRELYEETGVKTATLLTISPGWIAYKFPEGYRKGKKGIWKGQRQKWAAMLFQGDDSEVDLTAHGEQEFQSWRWGELEEMPELIVSFKRGVYEEMVQAFLPLRDYLRANTPHTP
ncbi:MAG: RNA pyrophosphohydrolase [bacterium]